jgi:hypothetical protein
MTDKKKTKRKETFNGTPTRPERGEQEAQADDSFLAHVFGNDWRTVVGEMLRTTGGYQQILDRLSEHQDRIEAINYCRTAENLIFCLQEEFGSEKRGGYEQNLGRLFENILAKLGIERDNVSAALREQETRRRRKVPRNTATSSGL